MVAQSHHPVKPGFRRFFSVGSARTKVREYRLKDLPIEILNSPQVKAEAEWHYHLGKFLQISNSARLIRFASQLSHLKFHLVFDGETDVGIQHSVAATRCFTQKQPEPRQIYWLGCEAVSKLLVQDKVGDGFQCRWPAGSCTLEKFYQGSVPVDHQAKSMFEVIACRGEDFV